MQTAFRLYLRTFWTWRESQMSNQNERRLLQKCLLLNNHLLWLLNNGLILLRADPEIVTIVFKVDIPYCDLVFVLQALVLPLQRSSLDFWANVACHSSWQHNSDICINFDICGHFVQMNFHNYVPYVCHINIFSHNSNLFWSRRKIWKIAKFWNFGLHVPDVCMIIIILSYFVMIWLLTKNKFSWFLAINI